MLHDANLNKSPPMPLFAAMLFDHPRHAPALRAEHRAPHRAHVRANDAPIRLVGPFLDGDGEQCGSFYLLEAEDEAEVRAWLAAEPYVAAGVYGEMIVRRFDTGMNRLTLQDWPGLG